MSSTLLALAGALSFLCANPSHHDGDNVRCSNMDRPIRLQGIDAPEMPGACRPGRECTPGDPFAARDELRSLTRNRDVRCSPEDTDDYGRIIARCSADGVDLSCAMIASGHAVPRYAAIDCGDAPEGPAAAAGPPDVQPEPARPPAPAPVFATSAADADAGLDWALLLRRLLGGFVWLLLVNGALWLYLVRFWPAAEETWERPRPLDTRIFLALAAIGGSPVALAGFWLRDPGDQQEPLEQPMTLIVGLHIGLLLGLLVLLVW
ncbi:thermonuclease family protein [Sandarakinorhabdus rubra]|uniref:thermonuclease family protein n=1 Tax=Sandarakinorhabdus rubra TaxID=2672568 RepID=UPI001969A47F|nr:thermonuclease family protein [Sandarakinorhabdus rubra]